VPAVDPATRQVQILVTVPNPTQKLVTGLFAQGRVIVVSRQAVTVPKAAIDPTGVRPMVSRVSHGVVERSEVEVGLEDPATERVEIRKGLAPGDTVLTGGVRSLPRGTPIRAQAPAERASRAPTN
jgi:membrane fusion protein (multidrug efflux system)